MDTYPAQTATTFTLAGVAFWELPLGAEGTERGASRLAGSARWPFEPASVASTVIDGIVRTARTQTYDVPDDLLFQAGQVFYHQGEVVEVRLTGLLPRTSETSDSLPFATWSTPIPPTVTAGPHGEVVLERADYGRSHLSALVVPTRPASSKMLVACLWDLHDSAPAEHVAEETVLSPPTSPQASQHLIVLNPAHYQAIRESLAHNSFTTTAESPWPTASITTGPARGVVQLRPVTVDAQEWM